MITLQPRQRVGHDILLARHGNHISTMQLDRANNRVVAMLDDGTWDSAPNLISPQLDMPATFHGELSAHWRVAALMVAAALVISGAAFALAVGMAQNIPSEQLARLMTYYPVR